MKEKTTLLQLLESLKDEDILMYDKIDILIEIAEDYELFDTMTQIVADEEINSLVQEHLDIGSSWETIYYMLSGIKMSNQRYYYFNGYKHLENLSERLFYDLLDDFIEEIKFRELSDIVIEKEIENGR